MALLTSSLTYTMTLGWVVYSLRLHWGYWDHEQFVELGTHISQAGLTRSRGILRKKLQFFTTNLTSMSP